MPTLDQLLTSSRNGDLVQALIDQNVSFLVVGGLAVAFHGCRSLIAVDDLDLLLEPTKENVKQLVAGLRVLGLQVKWSSDELAKPNVQLSIKEDFYVDILTPPDGVEFWSLNEKGVTSYLNNLPVRVVSREDLIALKRIAITRQKEDVEKHQRDLHCLTSV